MTQSEENCRRRTFLFFESPNRAAMKKIMTWRQVSKPHVRKETPVEECCMQFRSRQNFNLMSGFPCVSLFNLMSGIPCVSLFYKKETSHIRQEGIEFLLLSIWYLRYGWWTNNQSCCVNKWRRKYRQNEVVKQKETRRIKQGQIKSGIR